jgi:hypothetical protein
VRPQQPQQHSQHEHAACLKVPKLFEQTWQGFSVVMKAHCNVLMNTHRKILQQMQH